MGIVDEPVEDGVCDSRLADHIVPFGDGELGGDQGGSAAVAFLEDLEQLEALLICQTVGTPIVEDEKPGPRDIVDQAWKASAQTSHGHIFE